eukprot:c9142_g1_i1.p1 GENE.c9142_g1_i1~~c9142_g1_i1.p1  ORF type:complete len:752 (-),score=203.29 c9142_g1_i1:11-2236(-)
MRKAFVLLLVVGVVVGVPIAFKPSKERTKTQRSLKDVEHVKTVHVVQSCHLDVGFASTIVGELQNYYGFYLEAAQIAQDFRDNPGKNGEGLIFTTHSYVVSMLLDCPPNMGYYCPPESDKKIIREAIKRGDIALQAFPFNAETETFDRNLFEGALNLTMRLADDLGIAHPITMTQRDVPGATVAMIPLLNKAGVLSFSEGVNEASLPPDTPPVFRWKGLDGTSEVIVFMHPYGYGGYLLEDCIVLPNLAHALCPDYNTDNAGPWKRNEIESHWQSMMSEFPNATLITPSTWDVFVKEVASVRDSLPVIDGLEMGDTWIYGVSSDPRKNAEYREMSRALSECFESAECSVTDSRIANFTRQLIKNAEHTWGGDVKYTLYDETNWNNSDFHPLMYTAYNYQRMVGTWTEQRRFGLEYPKEALGSHPLAADIARRLEEIQNVPEPQPAAEGYSNVFPSAQVTCGDLTVSFDPNSGALNYLKDNSNGYQWLSDTRVIGELIYRSHSASEYFNFFDTYLHKENGSVPWWAMKDFGKSGVYNDSFVAESQTVSASLVYLWQNKRISDKCSFIAQLKFPPNFVRDYGAPQSAYVKYEFPIFGDVNQINISLTVVNKTATRLPESMWFRVNPLVPEDSNGWKMVKLGVDIDPLSVMANGSRHLHAVSDGIKYTHTQTKDFVLKSLDAPVISWGDANPFPIPCDGTFQPDLRKGANVCLVNNIWGTNYIMWYPYQVEDVNSLYRFQLNVL